MARSETKVAIMFPGQGGIFHTEGNIRPEIALYRKSLKGFGLLLSLFPTIKDLNPNFFGNSFGQYSAGAAAEVYTPEEGEQLIIIRADLIRREEERRVREGKPTTGMVVVLGQRIEAIRELVDRKSELYKSILAKHGILAPEELHHTNINSETTHVVSGDRPFLEGLVAHLGDRVAKLLPIEGMYHAESRRRLSEEYGEAIDKSGIKFKNPIGPIIASTRPRLLTTAEHVLGEIVGQNYHPVNIPEAVKLMVNEGIEVLIDPGPGQFANQTLKRNNPHFKVISLDLDKKTGPSVEAALEAARSFIQGLRGPHSPSFNP